MKEDEVGHERREMFLDVMDLKRICDPNEEIWGKARAPD
jgi:hypothetical protein